MKVGDTVRFKTWEELRGADGMEAHEEGLYHYSVGVLTTEDWRMSTDEWAREELIVEETRHAEADRMGRSKTAYFYGWMVVITATGKALKERL